MSTTLYLTFARSKAISFLRAVPVGLFLLSAAISLANAQSESTEKNDRPTTTIEGSWIFSIDRITQGVTFTALVSFTGGGASSATGSLDRLPGPPISPLVGTWTRTGPNQFTQKLYFFVFDGLGNAVGMIKNDIRLHLNSQKELIGTGEVVACDVQGENCASSPQFGTIHLLGKKIMPE